MLVTLIFVFVGTIWSAVKYTYIFQQTLSAETLALAASVILPLAVAFAALAEHPDTAIYVVRHSRKRGEGGATCCRRWLESLC